ncbi:MAG: GMC family oxidoreductase N-terminal domain-containing protein [Actinomycetota bacterium]|nr:GMC family oxidoreductase N-terminal domain-containing protein [Actinomycetota bacterium]
MRSLDAICETFAPGAVDQGVPDAVLDAIRTDLTPRDRRRLLLLLRTWLPGYDRLSQARREAVLRSWRDSPAPLMRTSFQALRKASLAFAYMLPGRWEAIGYPGPLGPREDAPAPRLQPLDGSVALELDCDVCVVGSGAGGGVAAAVLAAAGLDVVVLEAGGYWTERDFDGAEREGLRRLYRGGGAAATDDQGVGLIAGACVGGGTLVNYTTSFRTPNDVLEEWHGLGFPSAELGASLDAVCDRLGVNTDHNLPSRRDEVMRRGLDALGWHVDAMPRDVIGCEQGVACGYCGYGCPFGAKQSTMRTWLEDAAAAGARLVVGAKARRVLVDGGAAVGVDAGPVQVRARAVVAAAGAIETPALLLRSGLRNENVGRWLRLHPATGVFGIFEEEVRPWEGTLQALYSDQLRHLDGGYGLKYETIPAHPALLSSAVPWEGASQHQRLMESFPRTSLLAVIPRDSGAGRVRIGRDGQAITTYRIGSDDARRLSQGIDGAGRILAAAGAQEIFTAHARMQRWRDGFPPEAFRFGPGRGSLYSFHIMGSARMGSSPTMSAASPTGESWEVRNLVVADGSAFPTASGVNPMITIEAIAHLNARRLAERLV